MKMMTVGMMILCLLFGVGSVFAQANAVIYTLVQLTDECDGGDPLPDGTLVCIYWDHDSDGPDGGDPFPGDPNFSCFGMNGESIGANGTFYTDPALSFPNAIPSPNDFYIRVFIGEEGNLCWTSEVFTIPPGFSEIELDDWTCGPCPAGEVPGLVTGLITTLAYCELIYLDWNSVSEATGYRIYQDGVFIATTPGNLYDLSLPNGPACVEIRVQAFNQWGEGPISDPVVGCCVLDVPSRPSISVSMDLCEVVEISWTTVENPYYYSITRDGSHIAAVFSPNTSYDDHYAPPGIHQYSVRASNECGVGESSVARPGRKGTVLPSVTGVTASGNQDDLIRLGWDDLNNESAFEIWRSEFIPVRNFQNIATVAANVRSFDDFSAVPGQEYVYKISAYNESCGAGEPSVEARGHRTTVEPIIFGEVLITNNLSGVMSAEAADLDEDGDLDVVAAGMFADKVAWYENDGQWNFTEHVLLDRWQGARAVGVSDLDSDGDLDIAAVATFENALIWLEQHPDGFWFHHISSEVMGPTDILVGRTLGGLHSEIITAAGASGEISRWFYNGDAPFERQVFATNMPGARSLDFGRGALPSGVWLTAAAAGSGELVWWQSFNGYQRVSLGFHPGVVACGGALMDVETDSLIDVFFCTDDGFLGWYDREFGSVHEITSILDEPRDVTSGLMDRDDRQDLVVASGHEITWWRNTSNRFYRNVVTDNLPQASFVNTLDADGDGDMDILAAGDNEIRLYLSTLRDLDNTTQLVPAPEDEHDGQAFGLPTEYALEQNYPNPFNAQTTIRFALPAAGAVHLSIYDLTGREAAQLVNGTLNAGTHTVSFDAAGLASGVYFYRLEAAGYTETRKMVLMK